MFQTETVHTRIWRCTVHRRSRIFTVYKYLLTYYFDGQRVFIMMLYCCKTHHDTSSKTETKMGQCWPRMPSFMFNLIDEVNDYGSYGTFYVIQKHMYRLISSVFWVNYWMCTNDTWYRDDGLCVGYILWHANLVQSNQHLVIFITKCLKSIFGLCILIPAWTQAQYSRDMVIRHCMTQMCKSSPDCQIQWLEVTISSDRPGHASI